MTPPLNLNYTPYCFDRSENLHQVNSCEMPRPVCTEAEPAVFNDESRGLCYVVPMETCIEEIHRIPGLNLFRSNPPLNQPGRSHSQNGPSSPQGTSVSPSRAPSQQPQAPANSRQNLAPMPLLTDGGLGDRLPGMSWWNAASSSQRSVVVGLATLVVGPVVALAAAAAIGGAFVRGQ